MSRAVIDQPGFRVVVIGLALSFFLGLALRSQISDSRIQSYLDKAVSRLQSDFHVDYEHAKVNLSKWGLPFPVLEIQRIRLSPKSSACQSSQIYVDELEVPISIPLLLGLADTIPRIRLQEVELRFSDSSEKCLFQPAPAGPSAVVVTAPSARTEEPRANALFAKSTRAELKEVYIEQLRLIYAKKPDQPLLLRQINVELKYAERRLSELTLKSRLNAIKDSRSDFYLINANLLVAIKSKSAKDIDSVVNIEGKLLDGDIRLFAHNISGQQKIAFEISVDKVSGKALHPFIETDRQFKLTAFDRVPISFSFLNAGEIFMGSELGLNAEFKKILINIEDAQLRAAAIKVVMQKNSWVLSPFTLDIEGLPLTKLRQSDGLRGRLDSFESLGVLTGKLTFKDDHHYEFDGVLKNVEAVFSNRGRRDLQTIDELRLQLIREEQNVIVNARNFTIAGKTLASSLAFRHNLTDHSTSALLKMAGVELSPKIWEQFTFVEQSPLVDFTWNYRKSGGETHTLRLSADKVEIPGFRFENTSIDLTQVNSPDAASDLLHVNLHPRRVFSTVKLQDNEYVNQLIAGSLRVNNRVFSSDKTSLVLSGRNWRNLNFELQSTLSDIETKVPTFVSFKGSTSQPDGINSRISISHKGNVSSFDFITTPDSRLVLKPRQQ